MNHYFDAQFMIKLPFTHVLEIIPVSQTQLIVISAGYAYSVLILEEENVQILYEGFLPLASHTITFLSFGLLAFLNEDKLYKFDYIKNEIVSSLQIPYNKIYLEQHGFRVNNGRVIFWKSSKMRKSKNQNTTFPILYEIELYSLNDWKRIKKYNKLELNDHFQVCFCFGQVVLFQKTGYGIQVIMLDENKVHQIHSIYKVLLVDEIIFKDQLHIYYSYDELQNQLLCYKLRDNVITKSYVQPLEFNKIWFPSKAALDSDQPVTCFQLPELTKRYKNEELELRVRFKEGRRGKSLGLLKEYENDISPIFLEEIIRMI